MQSIFILALFGILYSTVAVITTMLSTSAMQKKIERIEFVQELFQEIEIGVKKGYLGDNPDFIGLGITPGSGVAGTRYAIDATIGAANARRLDNFIPRYVSYANDQLLIDPWGVPYILEMNYRSVTIYADSDPDTPPGYNNEVEAPVAVFMLYSAGPDRRFGTPNPGNTFNQMRRFEKPTNADGEDDIVHVFTTISTAQDMWNHTKETFDKMLSAVSDNYKQQYDLFTPTIQTDYYDVVNFYDSSFNWIGDDPAPSCGTALIHAWKDDSCNVPGVTGGNLTGRAGFPVMYPNTTDTNTEMMEYLGIDAEYDRMIPGMLDQLDLTVGSTGGGYLDRMDFVITEDAASQWTIEYAKRLEGSDIISGL
ncbi:MAG: hypothetical protein CMF61_03590 [Magnetococcales bacterium]|nr:hypothetical protein [Magnetococcales bacterium]PPR19559.1 MAG: hypothetical protein CFH43_00122 [Pseudomonadota bacterium]|tara:strand:+ start:316 stop:1410 length:1095 start_codon:yes stop_codon:yes gene_type:complete